ESTDRAVVTPTYLPTEVGEFCHNRQNVLHLLKTLDKTIHTDVHVSRYVAQGLEENSNLTNVDSSSFIERVEQVAKTFVGTVGELSDTFSGFPKSVLNLSTLVSKTCDGIDD